MPWDTQGLQSSYASGVLLADTGALGITTFNAGIYIYTGDGNPLKVDLQHRNSANNATLNSQIIEAPGGGVSHAYYFPFTAGLNERLRVVTLTSAEGPIQVSILR